MDKLQKLLQNKCNNEKYKKGPVLKKGKGKKNKTIHLVFLKVSGRKGNANSRRIFRDHVAATSNMACSGPQRAKMGF